MRASLGLGALLVSAAMVLTSLPASAEPPPWMIPGGGGPGMHRPPPPGGFHPRPPPGPGFHRPPPGPGWGGPPPRRYWRDDDDGAGAAVAAGIIGLAVGAIAAGAASNRGAYVDDDHVRWCLSRYRSYDPRTDTYLGRDGRRHYCR